MDSRTQSVPLRQHLLIDRSVQGSLLRRIALYSLACSLYFMMTLVITESLSNPKEAIAETTRRCLEEALFWTPGIMLLTPIIIYDLLKVTNRLAGPLCRLRCQMQQLADGETLEPMVFRDGDYWQEVAESFNQLRDELLRLRKLQARGPVTFDTETGSPSAASTAEGLTAHHCDNVVDNVPTKTLLEEPA